MFYFGALIAWFVSTPSWALKCAEEMTQEDWLKERPVIISYSTDEKVRTFWRDRLRTLGELRTSPGFRDHLFKESCHGQVSLGEYCGIYLPEGNYSGHLSFSIGTFRKKLKSERMIWGWGETFAKSSEGFGPIARVIATGPYADATVEPVYIGGDYGFRFDFDLFPGDSDEEKLDLFLEHLDRVLSGIDSNSKR